MYAKSTLSYSDAVSALEVFEESLTANPVHMLYQQWQLREAGALVRFTPNGGHRDSGTEGPAGRMSSCPASAGRSRPSTRSKPPTG